MTKPRTRSFRVTLEIPAEASIKDVKAYILDATQCWRGQLRPSLAYGSDDPGDPMWNLNPATITVTGLRK